MQKRWMLLMLIMAVVMIGGGVYKARYTPTSPEAMYESVAEFYSVVFDRSDIKRGTFKLWPKDEERVVLTAVLDGFEIDEVTRKTLMYKNTVVEVKTDYMFSARFSTKTVNVKVNLNGEDVEVPVTFKLRVWWQEITSDAAQQLKQLKSGESVKIKGEIELIYLPSRKDLDRFVDRRMEFGKYYEIKEDWKEVMRTILQENLGGLLEIKLHKIGGISLN